MTGEGLIGGTILSQATGQSYELSGTVDRQTQRAVWSYEDGQQHRVVMETGIYNLTKPQTTALVHFGPERMEVWQVVRLEQPTLDAAQPPAELPEQPTPLPELPRPQGVPEPAP